MTNDLRALVAKEVHAHDLLHGIVDKTWPQLSPALVAHYMEIGGKVLAALDAQAGMVMVPAELPPKVAARVENFYKHASVSTIWRACIARLAAAPAGPVVAQAGMVAVGWEYRIVGQRDWVRLDLESPASIDLERRRIYAGPVEGGEG